MPGDYGTRYTDAQRRETTRRIREIYGQAERDLNEKLGEFRAAHRLRAEKYQAMVQAGTMSKEDYEAWLRGQVFQSRQYEDAIAQVVNTMTNADRLALDIIDGKKRDIFMTNANFIGYDLEQGMRMNLGFGLYDAATVTRLIRDQPDLLRPLSQRKINEGKEIPYYQQAVTNSVTQGIIQGEGIDEICQRITRTCAQRGETAAMRDARTAYTAAQNAGRVEGMRQAEGLGIEIRKRWMATLDEKTRDAHQELDGQSQKVDDPFVVDGDEIMYPADPHAKAALVYNCRCTLVTEYPKYNRGVLRGNGVQVLVQTRHGIPRRDNMTGEDVGPMTYKEWKEWKAGEQGQPQANVPPAKFQSYERDVFDDEYKTKQEEVNELKRRENELYSAARALRFDSSRRDEYNDLMSQYLVVSNDRKTAEEELKKYAFENTAMAAQNRNIEYRPLKEQTPLDEAAIIGRIAGGDMTSGSCASLCYCYIGQRAGYDVLDFRGGASCDLIASNNKGMLDSLYRNGYNSIQGVARNYKTAGKRALNQAEIGTEYMFSCGRHAAIVRRTDSTTYEYLELQSASRNGWVQFNTSQMDDILTRRFGANLGGMGDVKATLVSVEQMSHDDRVIKIMGYINTAEGDQKKGSGGHER